MLDQPKQIKWPLFDQSSIVSSETLSRVLVTEITSHTYNSFLFHLHCRLRSNLRCSSGCLRGEHKAKYRMFAYKLLKIKEA